MSTVLPSLARLCSTLVAFATLTARFTGFAQGSMASLVVIFGLSVPLSASAFEGRIHAAITQGGQSQPLLYTVGTNLLRVEMTATKFPSPVDILDRNSGALTLLFPHNRSFVRLPPAAGDSSVSRGVPQMPRGLPSGGPPMPEPPGGMPPGVGPQSQTATMPGAAGMPAMPPMAMPMEKMELKSTGEKTNLFGFACERFELQQRGETMEIWATDRLLPFQEDVRNQRPRFGPQMIEEQWAGLLAAKKLFPIRAVLRFDKGPERYRFEVTSIAPQKLKDEDMKLFQPPEGYVEVRPLPF